ncbi:AAA family ATPase, partial [bacterium]|nr:AAA family ATPase [bacterium]
MIKRIKIEGYKSFKSLDLKLSPVSVIFGPNASGKSNLLDAIQLLSRMATCKTLGEAFDGHRGLAKESFHYVVHIDHDEKPIAMTFEVDVEISEAVVDKINRVISEKRKGIDSAESPKLYVREKFLRYGITLERLPETGHLRVMNEKLAALTKNGEQTARRRPFLERQDDGPKRRIHLRMEGQGHPIYQQVGLDHTIISTPLYEPHYPHIAAFREELSRWKTYYLEPKTLMRAEEPISPVQEVGPRGQNLAAFLN